MDVFKLLSRSAKPGAKTGTAQTQTLPSSGAAANPQLFGRGGTVGAAAGRGKRKRGRGAGSSVGEGAGEVVDDTADASLYAELDFFGAHKYAEAEGRKKRKRSAVERGAGESGDGEETVLAAAGAEVDAEAEEAYDAAESKRVLRAHKLKIAVLDDFAAQGKKEKSKKESKKESKESKKESKESKKESKEKSSKKRKTTKETNAKKQLYPQPLTDFAQLRTRYALSRRLADNIQEQGYKLPTEVQLGALPLLLRGRKPSAAAAAAAGADDAVTASSGAEYGGDIDLVTVAPTGSGKTVAFLVPVINALLAEGATDARHGPRAVVVAPTRELAAQIVNEARKLAKGTGVKAALMRKGMALDSERPDADDADDVDDVDAADSASDSEASDHVVVKGAVAVNPTVKAALLVTTPLALLNALTRRDGSVARLPAVRHMVLDEADVLLDPLFRDQTLAVWNACTNPLLRVGLWSATMGASVESLALTTLNTRWASLSAAHADLPPRPPLVRLVVGLKDTAIPNIHHQLTYAATEAGKLLGLRQLLHPTSVSSSSTAPVLRPPFLVFTQTIPRAIALHSELLYDIPPEAGGSSRIAVLHADLSSSARDTIMTRFRKGDIWVLITTDLLARGVDFRGLNGVVNFDAPTSAAAYVHRVGRTGRAGRAGGVAVTLYTQDDIPYVRLIANVIRASEKLRGVADADATVQQWLLDALPTPSKRDRAALKKRGVESRRALLVGKEARKSRISTKSGFERRIENNRRGAVEGSKRREKAARELEE